MRGGSDFSTLGGFYQGESNEGTRSGAHREGNLRQLDDWRASGLKMRAYCDAHGHSFKQWRAWRGVEQVWRASLGQLPPDVPGFAQGAVEGKPDAPDVGSVRITVRREAGAMQATLEVHPNALGACATLLREVLA